MKRDGYVTNVEEMVDVGQTVLVKVIAQKPKIALSLKVRVSVFFSIYLSFQPKIPEAEHKI